MNTLQVQRRPRLTGPIKVFPRADLSLLLVPTTGAWTVVSDTGKEVALLCDGQHSLAEIAAHLGSRYGIDQARAIADVAAYFDQLTECGLLADHAHTEFTTAPPPYQREVAIHLTARCNLQCPHCYARAGPGREEALPAEVVLEALEVLGERVSSFVFSGGEPLLYPRWREVLGHACELSPTKLVTNGMLMTPEDVAWLVERDISVQISLDGATAKVHDWLRGPQAFERVHNAVAMLQEAGHGQRVVLGCTLNRHNLEEACALLDLAVEWGVASVHFMPVNRHGRAAENWEALAVTPEQYAEVYRRLSARRRELRGVLMVTGCVGDYVERSLPQDGRPRCPVADNLMVECNGDLYPCIMLTGESFYLGRLGEVDLTEIYASETRVQAVQQCHARVETIPECAECDWRALCQGACPGAVLWQTGRLDATDGLCELRRELYLQARFEGTAEALDYHSRDI